MSEYLGQHWIAMIFITIALSLLSNGLWEHIRPIWKRISNALFSIITLGIKSRQDQIYIKAAEGHCEAASLYAFTVLYIAPVILLLIVQANLYFPFNIEPEIYDKEIINKCIDKIGLKPKQAEKEVCVKDQIREAAKTKLLIIGVISVFLTVIVISMLLSIYKINFTITYFNQSIRRIRPFIDETKLHLFEQRFALMKNQEDFDLIISDMLTIARDYSLTREQMKT
jgi:hypothetical protein